MKLALGLMFQNEAAWLHAHLAIIMQSPAIDGIVAIDGGSTDGGRQVIESWGGVVRYREWDWQPLHQENAVIEMAEQLGYDAILLTAPDELWQPAHIAQIKGLLQHERWKALRFPTYNFMKDRLHYCPTVPYYPDSHVRAWKLGCGIRHVGALDSVPNVSDDEVLYVPHIHMYHYAHIKDRRWYTLKGHNFHRARAGQPLLDELPDDAPLAGWPPVIIPFVGEDPLAHANIPVTSIKHPLPRPNTVPSRTHFGAFIYRDGDHDTTDAPVPWELLPTEPSHIIEVGGGIGAFSVAIKARWPHAYILAIESTDFDMLCLNLAHWRNVHCYKSNGMTGYAALAGNGLYNLIAKHDFARIDIMKLCASAMNPVLLGLAADELRRVDTLMTETDALPEGMQVAFNLVGNNGHYHVWKRAL
ncbi:MAG: hypothetical protein JNJ61_10820 [Anaerolineae bacterium]|nr:hypothetical protein [Anaerolineae bacterium]